MSYKTMCSSIFLASLVSFSSFAYKPGDKVELITAEGCSACVTAKAILNQHHIPFTTKDGTGLIPRLFVNGEYVGTGTTSVETYANAK